MPEIVSAGLEANAINFVPGAYGLSCGQHVGLASGMWYLQTAVADEEGAPRMFSDAIQACYRAQSVVAI